MVRWNGLSAGLPATTASSIPTATRSRRPDGGTHEIGLRGAISRGLKAYGELVGNKKASQITGDDVMGTSASMLSVFIREPEFQGQTKDKLATQEASRIVENTVRDAFDHWLADSPQQANKLLEWAIEQAEDRLRKRREKDISRQTATRKLRLPGKLVDCSSNSKVPALKSSSLKATQRRLSEAGARSQDPGGAAAARQDPQRRQCLIAKA